MIIYLLGKYNCWFFLEVIKISCVSVGFDEEFVLVECFVSVSGRKYIWVDCIFVFNFKNGMLCKFRCKLVYLKDLFWDDEEIKFWFEVIYLNLLVLWLK